MNATRIATFDSSEGSGFNGVSIAGSRPDLQLDVLREVLSTMDTLTEAGQRYTMGRFVALIRRRIPSGGLTLSPRNGAAVAHMLERLEQESTGFAVYPQRFVRGAQALLDLLEALVRRRDGRQLADLSNASSGALSQQPPGSA